MEPGDRIGRYVLASRLGVGGMGEVWEAVLEGPGGFRKPVALKFLHRAGARTGRSLVHEARLGGLLQHPNLVEVYALEEIDGRFVCAMELVRGGTLKEHLPLEPRAVVQAGLQVCAGLIHAHEQVGLVHLDLKPENLLLDRGVVKVADMGIARAIGSTGEEGIHGTPAYSAPEVLARQAFDARADVFSLGLVLNHLAAGQPMRHPEAVDWLAPVTRRCIVDDPNQRFRTMRRLAEALAELNVEGPGLEAISGSGGFAGPITRTPTADQSSATFQLDDLIPAAPGTNIGDEADRFVGRAAEARDLVAELDRPGLVTLKGTGGLGKTRLARHVARAWNQQNHLPAWFVDLTPARDRQGMLHRVAAVLEVPLQGAAESDAVSQLGHALRGRGPIALVLDNLEQLPDAPEVVGAWIDQAPELRVLATSRQPLHLPGERLVPLDPLSEDHGVELVIDRAAARGRTVEDTPDLRELVRRLDGLPLALELAAGRLGLLDPRQILDRLDHRFRLLRSADRATPARQLTLRGTLDWSWELLTEVERSALAQASLFEGGFTAEAAEAVWDLPDGTWVLDLIGSLLDRSLIHRGEGGRLGLYESTRAYAAEHLEDRPAAEARHTSWFARLGTDPVIWAVRSDGVTAHREVRSELDNLCAASRRAHALGRPEASLACARAAWAVLEITGPYAIALDLTRTVCAGPFTEARHRALAGILAAQVAHAVGELEASGARAAEAVSAADQTGEPRLRARARWALGRAHYERGDMEGAAAAQQEALEVLDGVDAPGERALALSALAVVHKHMDRFHEAREAYDRAREIYEEAGAPRLIAANAVSLAALDRDDDLPARARERLELAQRIARKVGDRRIESVAMGNLGVLALDASQLERAEALLLQTLDLRRELGDRRGEGFVLGTLGQVYGDMDRDDEAIAATEEALGIHAEVGAETWQGIIEGYLGQMVLGRDLQRGTALLQAAADRLEGRHQQMRAAFLCTLAEAHGRAGQHQLAQETLDTLFAIVTASSRVRGAGHAWCAVARVRALEGRLEESEQAIEQAARIEAELGLGGGSRLHNDLERARLRLSEARAAAG